MLHNKYCDSGIVYLKHAIFHLLIMFIIIIMHQYIVF